MPIITQTAQVAADAAGRVDRVVAALTGRSRAQVRGLIQFHCIQINGNPCNSDFDRVATGDVVTATYDDSRQYHANPVAPAATPFHILYEDDDVLVVDKAAHLLTVPTLSHEADTLVHLLQAYVSRGRKFQGRVEVVHRLDRGVSGALIFAKNRHIAELLRAQFAEHKPERHYVAIVSGVMKTDAGTFDKRLVVDKDTIHRRVAERPGEGEEAITHYTVEKRYFDATRVRIRLETGRRNQIRVHFADAGHPVLGDPRYSPEHAHHKKWRHKRMALHAETLSFTQPTTGRVIRVTATLPSEFATFAADMDFSPAGAAATRERRPTTAKPSRNGARKSPTRRKRA